MRARVVVGAVAALAALSLTHLWAFRRGQRHEAEKVAPAVRRAQSAEEYVHLSFAIKPLQLLARHPDALATVDADKLCGEVEAYVRAVEEKRLPELEEAGDAAAVRRYRKLTQEARSLLARCKR
jgi:hypothetical protein